jgi:hypothetical protein
MRLHLLLCLLILGPAVWRVAQNQDRVGVDFYNFWMLAKARAASPEPLPSPYLQPQAWTGVMNARADALWARLGAPAGSSARASKALAEIAKLRELGPQQRGLLERDEKFLVANARRRTLDPTASPLLYASFAFLPADYARADLVFAVLQALSFLLGTVLLWRAAGGEWIAGALLALLAMAVFLPYQTDLQVGNASSIHLLFAALPFAVACGPLARAPAAGARGWWGALAFALLALYVLLKPSFALLAAGLAAHVAFRLGGRDLVRAALPAAGAVLVLLAWPCVFFGSAAVWTDWLGYIGSDTEKLAYAIGRDNLSTPVQCAQWFGGKMFPYAALLGTLVLASLAAVLLRAHGETLVARFRAGLARLLADPFAAASAGLAVTLATAPLVWSHYTVIAMVPLAWAVASAQRPGADFWCIAAAVLLYGRSYQPLLEVAGLPDSAERARDFAVLAWLPLWIGTLLRIARAARAPD